jgi:DNA excision repair protein ERCC-3
MKAHFKLGLTATLVREDSKITDLNYMIGPKLYEENWLDLINNGFLARPYCIEVRVKMTQPFGDFYSQKGLSSEGKIMTHSANPNKFLAL